VCVVLGRMCVVLQVLSRSVVLQVLSRSVVLQVLGRMCVVLQVLGLGRGWGRGHLRSVHPPTKHYFRQPRATPEPQHKYMLNDTGTTPEGKKRYLPGMISKRYSITFMWRQQNTTF